MEWDEVWRQLPMASLNITINKFTEHEAVEHDFLVDHWHEVTSVTWNTRLLLKDGDEVSVVARRVAEQAVEHDMLHHSLVEHAVLHAQCELKGS